MEFKFKNNLIHTATINSINSINSPLSNSSHSQIALRNEIKENGDYLDNIENTNLKHKSNEKLNRIIENVSHKEKNIYNENKDEKDDIENDHSDENKENNNKEDNSKEDNNKEDNNENNTKDESTDPKSQGRKKGFHKVTFDIPVDFKSTTYTEVLTQTNIQYFI